MLAAAALGATAVAIPTVAGAEPDHSPSNPPTIEQVQKQLGDYALKNSQLIERFDQSRIVVDKRKVAAAKAVHAADLAARRLANSRKVLGASFTAMYERGSFSSTGALLDSENGSTYLDKLDTMSMISDHNAQLVREVTGIKAAAEQSRKDADAMLADAKDKLAALEQRREDVQAQVDKYKKLLATLTAAQQAEFFRSRGSDTASAADVASVRTKLVATKATPAAARKAVEFALDQVGKPYVWGSAGPTSYDCSGLTMASYRAAGISLPHSSTSQYSYGTHVGFDALRPGDLLFFYQPIGHVSIYIGDGLMVSAPQTGENVKVIPADTFGSDYTGATRLVG